MPQEKEKSAQDLLDEIAREEAHDKEWVKLYCEQQERKLNINKKKKLKL